MIKELVLKQNIEIMKEQKRQLPSSVDFMLLGTCDLKCPFCFGPRHEIPAMETSIALDLIRKIAASDTERIVFTGGEPTLIDDLPEILAEAKINDLTTVLSTNGLRLAKSKKLLAQIAPNLDWIALSLDGDTPEANSKMRIGHRPNAGVEHFEATLGLISRIRNEHPQLKIKLGTVVAQPNLDNIAGIPELLSSHDALPDTWKLYQISPSEYGKDNYAWLKVSDEEFERIYREAEEEALRVEIPNIVKYTNEERSGKYLFINPRGEALVIHSSDNDYYSIGNIIEDFDSVTKSWQTYINRDLLSDNFELTYL